MLATVRSATILGVDGRPVTVEVHVGDGLPGFTMVGLPDAMCREARDRARAAVQNTDGVDWPPKKVTVNLAPSSERKVGTGLDLAIALGYLAATEQVPPLGDLAVVGELGLDGSLRPVPGTLALVDAVEASRVLVPRAAHHEAGLVGRVEVVTASSLAEVIEALRGAPWPDPPPEPPPVHRPPEPDLADVRGQPVARLGVEVSAAGGHHLLLVGAPGAGKTMIARRLPGLLPDLPTDEAMIATRAHSAAGVGIPGGLVTRPPFRAPHHSSTMVALVGGGTASLRPGELSLSTGGVLFLDELGEFPPAVVDSLRQPLEEGVVRVSRARASVVLPARFLLVAATNPCPCGGADEPGACRCSEAARARYGRRLSGPVLDRFDLRVHVARPEVSSLLGEQPGEPSGAVAERVAAARAIAATRGLRCNADIPAGRLDELTPLTPAAKRSLEGALEQGRLTARGLARVRRVARTLADLDGTDAAAPLGIEAISLAMTLRSGGGRHLESVA